MKFMKDVMAMKMPDPTDKTFGKVLQIKQQVAQSMMTATVRIQSGLLRPPEDDGMEVVLKAMRAAQNDDLPAEEDDADIFA